MGASRTLQRKNPRSHLVATSNGMVAKKRIKPGRPFRQALAVSVDGPIERYLHATKGKRATKFKGA